MDHEEDPYMTGLMAHADVLKIIHTRVFVCIFVMEWMYFVKFVYELYTSERIAIHNSSFFFLFQGYFIHDCMDFPKKYHVQNYSYPRLLSPMSFFNVKNITVVLMTDSR